MTDERKRAAQQLCGDIENDFHEVTEAVVEDATRDWYNVRISVTVNGDATEYFNGAFAERTGYEITTNLRGFAPRLYNYIDSHRTTLEMERPPIRHPERVTELDDLYDSNLYLIDVFLP